MQTFAKQLAVQIKLKGWSNVELAARLAHEGISVGEQTVKSWTAGNRTPRMATFQALVKIFGCNFDGKES